FQAEDGIRDRNVTGVQTCALPILDDSEETGPIIPAWVYVVGGILLVAIIIALIMWRRSKNTEELDEYEEVEIESPLLDTEIPEMEEKESEETIKRKQLEKMAKDKPEEFTKLLRSWISED